MIPRYEYCGSCCHYHPLNDPPMDCRDDARRQSETDLDDRHGPRGWIVVNPEDADADGFTGGLIEGEI